MRSPAMNCTPLFALTMAEAMTTSHRPTVSRPFRRREELMSHLRIAAPWRNLAAVLGFVLAALTVSGCPKSYPDCDDDSTCKKHNEVCVDGRCHQCRDNSQCSAIDACQTCQGNACVRRPGCCKSDLDCPNGKCWKQGDGETGQCGGVCQTSAAALESCLRLPIEATIAVKINGGTSARSSWTKIEPMVDRASASQFGSPAASGPRLRATRPRRRPTAMAARTWKPNEL